MTRPVCRGRIPDPEARGAPARESLPELTQVSSAETSTLPSGVTVRPSTDGTTLHTINDGDDPQARCWGLHGKAVVGSRVSFGCHESQDGGVLVVEPDEATGGYRSRLTCPGYPEATTAGTSGLVSHPDEPPGTASRGGRRAELSFGVRWFMRLRERFRCFLVVLVLGCDPPPEGDRVPVEVEAKDSTDLEVCSSYATPDACIAAGCDTFDARPLVLQEDGSYCLEQEEQFILCYHEPAGGCDEALGYFCATNEDGTMSYFSTRNLCAPEWMVECPWPEYEYCS